MAEQVKAPVEEPIYNENGIMSEAWWIYFTQSEINNNDNSDHATSDGTSHSDVVLNNTHRGGNGSDHGFIDQDVTISSSPSFAGLEVDSRDVLRYTLLQG